MKTLFAAAVAVSMLTGTVTTAYADNDRGRHERHHDNHGNDHRDYRDDHRDHGRRDWDRHDNHARNERRDWNRHDDHARYEHRDWDRHDHGGYERRDAYRSGYMHGRYDRGRYIAPRGYYVRTWRHGDYLPRAYYDSRYIVRDYHVYHLSPPPRGHHWVRVNNDVVLAAVTSGLVVSVVNGLFY